MLRYAQLSRKPRVIRSLTGLLAQDFVTLLQRFEPLWEAAEHQRLSWPQRQRGIGAGHPYALAQAADKLLLFLAICRLGLTFELAGILFGLDTSNAHKLFGRLVPLVQAAADPELGQALQEARRLRGKSGGKMGKLQQLLEAHPELAEVAVDATEQPIYRPGKKRPRKSYYSGKKKRHTLKTQIVVSSSGQVLHVSKSYPGRQHDKRLYEQERLHEQIPPPTKQFLDLGYPGLDREHPESDIRLPHQRKSPGCKGKGQKGKELTRGQKQANGLRSRRRIIVENRLAAIKGFRLLREIWRCRHRHYNAVFRTIAALTNFRLQQRSAATGAQAA